MNKTSKRVKEYRQRGLNKSLFKDLLISLVVIFFIVVVLFNVTGTSRKNLNEDENITMTHESTTDHGTIISSANVSEDVTYPIHKKWNPDETHLLAMIAMAEAEGESLDAKIKVILTVLNRVYSDEFPDTIREVIFEQNSDGVYQFECIENGRWESMGPPTTECWEAVQVISVLEKDISNGALYFESCEGESWHSENLTLVCLSDSMRFYR